MDVIRIATEVWRHPGNGGWHFATFPGDVADELRARLGHLRRPFGSLPVRATIGRSSWETSLFADSKSASYLLPVKADIRRRERIEEGDTVTLTLQVQERACSDP